MPFIHRKHAGKLLNSKNKTLLIKRKDCSQWRIIWLKDLYLRNPLGVMHPHLDLDDELLDLKPDTDVVIHGSFRAL